MLRATFDVILLAGAIFAAGAARDPQVKIPPPPVPLPEVDPKMPMFVVCAKACNDCARQCDTWRPTAPTSSLRGGKSISKRFVCARTVPLSVRRPGVSRPEMDRCQT